MVRDGLGERLRVALTADSLGHVGVLVDDGAGRHEFLAQVAHLPTESFLAGAI